MAKIVIVGAAGASAASVADPTVEGPFFPVKTGRRKDDGH